jgi:hypothetical protein
MRNDTIGILSKIKETNRGLMQDVFIKDTLNKQWMKWDDSGALVPVHGTIEYVNDITGATVSESLDSVLSITQIFRNSESLKSMTWKSARAQSRTTVIREFFDIDTATDTLRTQHGMFSIAERMQRYGGYVHNVDPLVGKQAEFNGLSQRFLGYINKLRNLGAPVGVYIPMPEVFARLKMDPENTIDAYATAQYLYYTARGLATKLKDAEFAKMYDPEDWVEGDALRILANPSIVREYPKRVEQDLSEAFFRMSIQEGGPFAWMQQYMSAHAELKVKSLQEQIDLTQELIDAGKRYMLPSLQIQNGYRKAIVHLQTMMKYYNEAVALDASILLKKDKKHVDAFMNKLIKMEQVRSTTVANQILALSDEQLLRHLYHRSFGRIAVGMDVFGSDAGTMLYRRFVGNIAGYKKLGIHVIEDRKRLFLILDGKRLPKWEQLPLPDALADIPHIASDLPSDLVEAYEGAYQELNRLTVRKYKDGRGVEQSIEGAARGSVGETMDAAGLDDFDYNLPEAVRKLAIPSEHFSSAHLKMMDEEGLVVEVSSWALPRFDFSNLGDGEARKKMRNYASMNPMKTYINSIQRIASFTDAPIKDMAAFVDENVQLHHMFDELGFDKAETLAYLKQNKDFVVAALVADEKAVNGRRLVKIVINNLEDLRIASEANGVILHQHIYTKLAQSVNSNIITNRAVKWWEHNIVRPMRIYMLMSVGFPFRNIIDSGLKTLQFSGLRPSMVTHTLETARIFQDYTAIVREMLSDPQLDKEFMKTVGYMTPERILRYFELHPDAKLNADSFNFIHEAMVSSYMGGITKAQMDLIIDRHSLKKAELYEKNGMPMPPDDPEFIKKILYDNHLFHLINDTNGNVETIYRLSVLTYDMMHNGKSFGGASASVLRTHFDYGTKSKTMRMLETAIPFSNFTLSNMRYWADLLETRGFNAALFADILRPMTNQDEQSIEELETNRSLQMRMLSGNIQLDDNGLVLKLNPSFMDALQTYADPVGQGRSRLLSILGIVDKNIAGPLLGDSSQAAQDSSTLIDQLVRATPYIGVPYQRIMTSINNTKALGASVGSVLPSMFGNARQPNVKSYTAKPVAPKTPAMPRAQRSGLPQKKQRTSAVRQYGNMTRTGLLLTYGLFDTPASRNYSVAPTVSNRYIDSGQIDNQIQVLLEQRKQSMK